MSLRQLVLGAVSAVALAAALPSGPALGQDRGLVQIADLNISGQPTNLALQRLADEFHFQIVAFSEDVAGKTSRPLQGRYTSEEALREVLAGTNLHFRRIDERTIAVGSRERIEARNYKHPINVQLAQAAPRPALPATAPAAPGLEEITVTARRREENLQSVPIAITTMGQDKLTQNNIQSIVDMQSYVPSLGMFGPFRNTPIVSIRGQGGFTPGGIPSVVMYMNEVPAPTSAQAGSPGGALGGNGLFFDLESVQVLKGPQGTLFGRNTTGGAVLLQSRRPQEQLGGHLQITAGNYKNREIDGAVNIPLVDNRLLARVAVNGQKRDGFTKSISPNGKDLDDANHFAVRGSVTFRPSDTVENLLIVDSINSKSNGTSAILRAVNTNPAAPVNRLFPTIGTLFAQQQALGIRRQIPLNVGMFSSQNRWSVVDILKWEVTDDLTIRNIASASRARYAQTIDGDGTAFPIFDPIVAQDVPYITRQYTEEVQAQGRSFDGILDWTVGFFYLNQPEEDDYTRHTNATLGAFRSIGFKQSESTKAIFGQADTDLSSVLEGLSLTTGFRYTWETISRLNRDIRSTGVCTSPFSNASCVLQGRDDFAAPTWTIGLNYKPDADTLLYAASRRGFRSGGFNLAGDVLPSEKVYNQEYVTDVEIGAKTDWSLGTVKLRNSMALYRQFYSDIQLSQVSVSAITGGPLTVTKNAGKAHITGFEAEMRASFNRYFQLGGHLAWMEYKFKKIAAGVAQPLIVANIPKIKYGLDATINLPVDEAIGNVSFTANWNWKDKVFLSSINDPLSLQSSYGLLTVGAAWRNIGRYPVDLSFFMTNVTNTEFAIGGLPLSTSVGTSTIAYGAPRMWGFRLGYRFGGEA